MFDVHLEKQVLAVYGNNVTSKAAALVVITSTVALVDKVKLVAVEVTELAVTSLKTK